MAIRKSVVSGKYIIRSLVCFVAFATLLSPSTARGVEGGYPSATSVRQGDTIRFHISTRRSSYTLSIYREGAQRVLMKRVTGLSGSEHSCPEPGYETGCGWPVAYVLQVPSNWPSGVYTGEFDTGSSGSSSELLPFVVREDQPGSTSVILMTLAANTHHAYNSFGGKSLYGFNSSNGDPARKVSFNRPYANGDGSYYRREHPFVEWAESQGYIIEYATNVDVHRDPGLLGRYSCFVMVGHDEYWSREMRDHLDNFISAGGNAAILSGNTCWWQVRFSSDLETMTCYKSAALNDDPFAKDSTSSNDHLITTNWYKSPVNYPENTTIGLSFRNGGYHDNGNSFTYEQGFGGYKVYRTQDWVFEGTGLSNGQILGRDATIVGYEVDGTLVEARDSSGNVAWDSKKHYPATGALPYLINTSQSKTPSNFVILGIAPATTGYAVMGYFQKSGGGRVFNAGTIDWVQGLASDSKVARITSNVLDAFIGSSPSPPPPPPPPPDGQYILDNGDAGTTANGSWNSSGGPDNYGTKSLYSRQAGATYEYRFELAEAGTYEVCVWWTEWPSRRTDVPLSIFHPGGTAEFSLNQQADGGRWLRMGAWSFGSEALVVLESLGDGSTCADAVKLLKIGGDPDPVPDPNPGPEFVLDDGDAGTLSSGSWNRSGSSGFYGTQSLYSREAGATYEYRFQLAEAGTYEVCVWWTEWSSRRTDVPLSVVHEGGTAKRFLNQRSNGGRWNPMGSWSFGSEALVIIESLGGGSTCADAVKLVKVDGDPDPDPDPDPGPGPNPGDEVVLDNGDAGTSASGSWKLSGGPDYYGTQSLYSKQVGATYSYRFALATPGTYDVFIWWTQWPSRRTDVPVSVVHSTGTARIPFNQQTAGGRWNRVGSASWSFGSEALVTIESLGDGSTCADAIKLVPVAP